MYYSNSGHRFRDVVLMVNLTTVFPVWLRVAKKDEEVSSSWELEKNYGYGIEV
jgi:hypothetical protein